MCFNLFTETHVDRSIVYRVQMIVEFEPVPRLKGSRTVQDLVEQRPEHFRWQSIHRVGQNGSGRLSHPRMVQAPVIHEQPLRNFPERILLSCLV